MNNLYIKYRKLHRENVIEKIVLMLPKDEPRIFQSSALENMDLKDYVYFPNFGGVYVKPLQEQGSMHIEKLDQFLYTREPSSFNYTVVFKCVVNEKQGPFYTASLGRDIFVNQLLNIEQIISQNKIKLVDDIEIICDGDGDYEKLMFAYYDQDNKIRRLKLEEDGFV